MNYSTRLALGVKDYHLELDEQHFARPIEGQSDRIVIHLIRSYPIRCVNTRKKILFKYVTYTNFKVLIIRLRLLNRLPMAF